MLSISIFDTSAEDCKLTRDQTDMNLHEKITIITGNLNEKTKTKPILRLSAPSKIVK